MKRLKKNDTVVVIAGKDKGKTGKVLVVIPETDRAIVERVNTVKHFVRPDRSKNVAGGVMEKEAPLHVSNLMVWCEDCGAGSRVRTKVLDDGSRVRACAKCGALLEKSK